MAERKRNLKAVIFKSLLLKSWFLTFDKEPYIGQQLLYAPENYFQLDWRETRLLYFAWIHVNAALISPHLLLPPFTSLGL